MLADCMLFRSLFSILLYQHEHVAQKKNLSLAWLWWCFYHTLGLQWVLRWFLKASVASWISWKTWRSLLKIQCVCAILLQSVPERLALLSSTHRGTGVGRFSHILSLENSFFSITPTKRKYWFESVHIPGLQSPYDKGIMGVKFFFCTALWFLPDWRLLASSPWNHKTPPGLSYLLYVQAAHELNQSLLKWPALPGCFIDWQMNLFDRFLIFLPHSSLSLPDRRGENPPSPVGYMYVDWRWCKSACGTEFTAASSKVVVLLFEKHWPLLKIQLLKCTGHHLAEIFSVPTPPRPPIHVQPRAWTLMIKDALKPLALIVMLCNLCCGPSLITWQVPSSCADFWGFGRFTSVNTPPTHTAEVWRQSWKQLGSASLDKWDQ